MSIVLTFQLHWNVTKTRE